jgi:ribosome-binding factor A
MKEKSQRQIRVENLVRQEVSSAIVRDLNGYLPSPVSVVRVDVSKDLRYATVFFSCVDANADVKEVLYVLKEAAPHLNRQLGRVIHTKYTPRLRFRHDDSFDHAHDINRIFHEKIKYSEQTLAENREDEE